MRDQGANPEIPKRSPYFYGVSGKVAAFPVDHCASNGYSTAWIVATARFAGLRTVRVEPAYGLDFLCCHCMRDVAHLLANIVAPGAERESLLGVRVSARAAKADHLRAKVDWSGVEGWEAVAAELNGPQTV